MYRILCDRCGELLHLAGAAWDTEAPEVVAAGVGNKRVDLCPPCAQIVYASMIVYVASCGGYQPLD